MKHLLPASLVLLGMGIPPAFAASPLPPEISSQIRKGRELHHVWFRPGWDPASGFTVGKVEILTSGSTYSIREAVRAWLPSAFGRLAIASSPNVLDLAVTDCLGPAQRNNSQHNEFEQASIAVEVEGRIRAKDGTLLMVFTSDARSVGRESHEDDAMACLDQIAWALSRDLGPAWQRNLETQRDQAPKQSPLAIRLAPPPPAGAPRSPQERLLALDDLKQKGLVTAEEYQALRAKILAGPAPAGN